MRYIKIILLLVLCLLSLLLTSCITNTIIPEIGNENLENQTVEESATEESANVEADTTKPVITGSRTTLSNSSGWTNTDVIVSFTCADVGSVQSGIDINTVAGRTVTTEGENQSVTNTGTCIDEAGNIADPATVSNINIDKTLPVVTITLPDTGEYVLNQSVAATWSATDALSGVASPSSGTVLINTSSLGTKTFTLPAGTAKDKAGNSSLKVTKTYTVVEDTEDPVTENPQKWSGLGMMTCDTNNTSEFDSYVDTLLDNGFTQIRMNIRPYEDPSGVAQNKAAVGRAIAKGADIIWGIGGYPEYDITDETWVLQRAAILAAAQWAQDNGVYEFQIGNEEEWHVDGDTMTIAQLITNLKSVATEVKAIFTNGNVSYSCFGANIDDWITAGKGDIDILASNIYMGGEGSYGDGWKTLITELVNAFGSDGTYLTEFAPSWSAIDDYSEDEAVQAAAETEMIEYIKASGMTRAIAFLYKGHTSNDALTNAFGILKTDGTYRLLWNQALLNSDSVRFATVPTKTTTASLLGTIALIPK